MKDKHDSSLFRDSSGGNLMTPVSTKSRERTTSPKKFEGITLQKVPEDESRGYEYSYPVASEVRPFEPVQVVQTKLINLKEHKNSIVEEVEEKELKEDPVLDYIPNIEVKISEDRKKVVGELSLACSSDQLAIMVIEYRTQAIAVEKELRKLQARQKDKTCDKDNLYEKADFSMQRSSMVGVLVDNKPKVSSYASRTTIPDTVPTSSYSSQRPTSIDAYPVTSSAYRQQPFGSYTAGRTSSNYVPRDVTSTNNSSLHKTSKSFNDYKRELDLKYNTRDTKMTDKRRPSPVLTGHLSQSVRTDYQQPNLVSRIADRFTQTTRNNRLAVPDTLNIHNPIYKRILNSSAY